MQKDEQVISGQTIFVGTYTRKESHVDGQAQGISTCILSASDSLKEIHLTTGLTNPSYLAIHPSRPLLYTVSETADNMEDPTGSIFSFSIQEDHSLQLINSVSAVGNAPCYISVDADAQKVYTANYVTGNIVVCPILEDGALGASVGVIAGSGSGPTDRQKSPHAHFILKDPTTGYIFSTDLGADKIKMFKPIETAPYLELVFEASTIPGAGPRHIAYHPILSILYVLNELNGTIESFQIEDSKLTRVQVIASVDSTLEGNPGSADIVMTSDGAYLYASNRGDYNSVASFAINEEGILKLIGHVPSQGDHPRNMMITPDDKKLLVANQNTNNVYVYNIDPQNGHLVETGVNNNLLTPVCMVPYQ